MKEDGRIPFAKTIAPELRAAAAHVRTATGYLKRGATPDHQRELASVETRLKALAERIDPDEAA